MYTFLYHFIYPSIYQLCVSCYNYPSVARNIVGLFDATTCIFSAIQYSLTGNEIYFQISLLLPYLYYQWDLYYIFFFALQKELIYVFHHLIALYIIYELLTNSKEFREVVYPMFIAAELSNIPTHMTYHVIKCYPSNKYLLLLLKTIQFFIFTFTRIFFYTYLLFTVVTDFPGTNFFLGCLFLVYLAGLLWYKGLIKSLNHDLRRLEQNSV